MTNIFDFQIKKIVIFRHNFYIKLMNLSDFELVLEKLN